MPYKDPATRLAYGHTWRAAHKGQLLAYDQAYRVLHKDTLRQQRHDRYETNKPAILAQNARYHAANRAEDTTRKKAWRLANPEKHKSLRAQRRAQKKGALVNDLTHAQWLAMQDAQDHCCHYCGKRCKGHLTQDHIIPLSKGGSHTLHNVIGACIGCNSKKNTGPPPTPVQPFLLTIAASRKPKKKAS